MTKESDARRHQLVATCASLVATGGKCQPGYMVRGRRNAKKTAAEEHRAAEAARAEVERTEAAERSRRVMRIMKKAGGERGALDRLSQVSREIERLHREEQKLLRERDALVDGLRDEGQAWNALCSRTRLSRQALMKRASTLT